MKGKVCKHFLKQEELIMEKRLFNLLTCLALFVFCIPSSKAEAIFASVKATGRAATCIADPLDSLVGAYNPAGITGVGDRLDVEGGWTRNFGTSRVSGNLSPLAPLVNRNFQGMRTHDVYPGAFGLTKAFCVCDYELAAGVVFYNRNYQKTTYNRSLVLLGTSHLGLEYFHQTLSPILAIRICNSHSFGISGNYQVERLKVNGLENFDNALFSNHPGRVTNNGYSWATGWSFTLGYWGQLTDCLSIGLTYQPKTCMHKLGKYKGFLAEHGKLNIPPKYGAGIAYRVLPCVTVAFDVEYIQWDRIRSLRNRLLHHGVLERLGTRHGPGFGFRNQTYYRIGAEWQIDDCWAVRVGFRHANSPVRKSQTTINLLTIDCVEDFATIGATWSWRCFEVSSFFAWGFQNRIRGRNVIPAQFGGGNVRLKEQKYALGLAIGWCY
jgi:long-chain fatty acid transport protein